jgi:vacuolar-type H+-ATPase subunit F/Vma7
MKVEVRAICRPETALGLGLAGIAPIVATSGAEAAAALGALAHAPGKGGVVLIESALHDALPSATRRQIQKDGAPIVMPFPGPADVLPGAVPEQELLDLLRRAIGYRVRLR